MDSLLDSITLSQSFILQGLLGHLLSSAFPSRETCPPLTGRHLGMIIIGFVAIKEKCNLPRNDVFESSSLFSQIVCKFVLSFFRFNVLNDESINSRQLETSAYA